MPRRRTPGVFCLETPWDDDLRDASTVGPLLAVLEQRRVIKFIHRDVATRSELEHYLDRWLLKKYADYPIGYMAFHGHRGAIELAAEDYTLDQMGDAFSGRMTGRMLYFGSCATVRITEPAAKRFLRTTGATAVCGYTRSVDWIESASFDLNLIEALTRYARPGAAFNHLERNHDKVCERVGFKWWTRSGTR